MQDPSELSKKYHQVLTRIHNCAKSGKAPTLVAVSKKRSIQEIVHLAELGQIDFAENYLQEAIPKINAINQQQNFAVHWHYIGAIQSNKTQLISQYFDWVHTVDRDKIVHRLADHRNKNIGQLNICIQVNIDASPTKSGVNANIEDIKALGSIINQYHQLCWRGLMCIPDADPTNSKEKFENMAYLYTELKKDYPKLDTLSMGMSQDFTEAITAGSTIVRIGTDIFGPRH